MKAYVKEEIDKLIKLLETGKITTADFKFLVSGLNVYNIFCPK